MKFKPRTNMIVLWLISIGLMVGMVIMFTPTLGGMMGGTPQAASTRVLQVDGEPITEFDLSQARQGQPVFSAVGEGPVHDDLQLMLADQVIRQQLVNRAAARMRVSNADVRSEVQAFRERNGVDGSRNDQAYLRLIGSAGFTDQTFRDYLRQQLQIAAWQAEITEDVTVSDAEVASWFEANRGAYRTEPRVVARHIEVSDRAQAEALRDRALAGEPFAELAAEASLARADVGGAVGGSEPTAVGRPAFPSAVANAVFSRSTPGVTPVVEAAGRFHLVEVIERVPAAERPLEEVFEQVREDALDAKREAAVQVRINELRAQAEIEVLEPELVSFEDPVVARVGDREIRRSELVRATYGNPQIQQALGPQTASLIHDFFKPSILEQLIDRRLAVLGAAELDGAFFGTDAMVAQMALATVARDAVASDERIESVYADNRDRYTVPASAEVWQVEFDDEEAAFAYRQALLDGADPVAAAEETGGDVNDRGTVGRGELEGPLDTALFDTEAFEALPNHPRSVSDVLVIEETIRSESVTAGPDVADEEAAAEADAAEADAEEEAADAAAAESQVVVRHVVLVALRTPSTVLPIEEVHADVEATVLAQERQRLQRAWLEELRAEVEVEVLDADLAEPAADDPAFEVPAEGVELDTDTVGD